MYTDIVVVPQQIPTQCPPQISTEHICARKLLSEATATRILDRYFREGSGDAYTVGTTRSDTATHYHSCNRWHDPGLHAHLKGEGRGWVVDELTALVPTVAIDDDKPASVERARIICDYLSRRFPGFPVSAEINNGRYGHRGACKYNIWFVRGTLGSWAGGLWVHRAIEIGETVQRDLASLSVNVEVFPTKQLPNIRYPLHPQKTTFIDAGAVPLVIRKRRPNAQAYYYQYGELPTGMEEFETQSSVAFLQFLQRRGFFAVEAFLREVERMQGSRPVPEVVTLPAGRCEPTYVAQPEHDWPDAAQISQIENALDRQYKGLLIACRQAGQVLDTEAGLQWIRDHKLFSGDWYDGERVRAARVAWILKRIARTFDPKLCRRSKGDSQRPEINEKCRYWMSRSHELVPQKLVTINRVRRFNDDGTVSSSKGKRIIVRREWCCRLQGIIEHISQSNETDVPRESIEGWWTELHEERLMPKWDRDLYIACRKVLVGAGWLVIDHGRYVPKHQSKGMIPVRHQEQVGEEHYSYPISPHNTVMTHECVQNTNMAVRGGRRMSGMPPPRPPTLRFSRFGTHFALLNNASPERCTSIPKV